MPALPPVTIHSCRIQRKLSTEIHRGMFPHSPDTYLQQQHFHDGRLNSVPSHLAFQAVSILLDVVRRMIWQQPINYIQPDIIGKLKSAYSVCKASVPQELHRSECVA